MNNAGFSAPVNYWGAIAGLTPKTSKDGKTNQVAEAPNEYGDTIAHDTFGEVIAPEVVYSVTGNVVALPALGSVFTYGTGADAKKLMLTKVAIDTTANQPPSVAISGVQVEATATAKRTYTIPVALTPRSKAQDVAGAFTASQKFTTINTTYEVDPHVETVGGVPVASDASHGRISVQATVTDGDGTETVTASQTGGFTVTASPAEDRPDSGYRTIAATATKYLIGSEGSSPTVLAIFYDGFGNLIAVSRVTSGSTPTPPTSPTHDGYTFDAWSPTVGAITADTVYTATWTDNA